ncbi:MAG TPA: hypothetical protein VMR43_01445, partial [Variovorax sp.]|nr:hypothetical protein [Variovorax sp.]
RHHEDFMAAYAPPGAPVDRFARVQHRAHPWYISACRFADDWDCRAFEPKGGLALATVWPLLAAHAEALDRAARSRLAQAPRAAEVAP